jgi:hypothetical protein
MWLDFVHMNAAIQKLNHTFDRLYISYRIPETWFWSTPGNYLEPETHNFNYGIYIIHVTDHWVLLTNKHPHSPGKWIIYDSMNNAKYVHDSRMRLAMRVLAPESKNFIVDTVAVVPQNSMGDCGLFALAYAQAIANDIDPATISFHQNKLRDHYNTYIRSPIFRDFPFSHIQLERHNYNQHEVLLEDIPTQSQYYQYGQQLQ